MYSIRKFNGAFSKDHKLIRTSKIKNFNQDTSLSRITRIYWEQIATKTDNINQPICKWKNLFPLLIKKHAPLNRICVSVKCSHRINEDLKTLMQSRDRLKKVAVKSKSPAFMRSYRKTCNATYSLNIQLKKTITMTKLPRAKGTLKVLGKR